MRARARDRAPVVGSKLIPALADPGDTGHNLSDGEACTIPGGSHDAFQPGCIDHMFIDSVNSKSVEAIPLKLREVIVKDGEASGVAEVNAKILAKLFARGINRFDVAYTEAGARHATEVVMDVQM
jgi:hypothetical protein